MGIFQVEATNLTPDPWKKFGSSTTTIRRSQLLVTRSVKRKTKRRTRLLWTDGKWMGRDLLQKGWDQVTVVEPLNLSRTTLMNVVPLGAWDVWSRRGDGKGGSWPTICKCNWRGIKLDYLQNSPHLYFKWRTKVYTPTGVFRRFTLTPTQSLKE